jgi:hypothetical protein
VSRYPRPMERVEFEIHTQAFLSFDGRVFEIFGRNGHRYYVKHLKVVVRQPDKQGKRAVTFETPPVGFSLDESEFEGFRPLLDALRASGVEIAE